MTGDARDLHHQGLAAYQAGQYAQAADLISRAVALHPNGAGYRNNLGLVWLALKNYHLAEQSFRQAISLNPILPEAHVNLGIAQNAQNQFDKAIASYRRAIALRPDNAQTHNLLGISLHNAGHMEEAIAAWNDALKSNPDDPDAHSNLGEAYWKSGRLSESLASCRRALLLRPNFSAALNNLGNTLRAAGQSKESEAAFRAAVAQQPDFADAWNNLGNVLRDQFRGGESEQAFLRAIQLNPNFTLAITNLASLYRVMDRPDEAIQLCRRAIALGSSTSEALLTLGNNQLSTGQLDAALATFETVFQQHPSDAIPLGNRVFVLMYHPDTAVSSLRAEQKRWNDAFAVPLREIRRPHDNNPDPDRPLRIGYVSGDFNTHAVGYEILPIFLRHDPAQFQLYCYSNSLLADELTLQFKSRANLWRDILPLSDEQAARIIRDDRIDILMDLSLFSEGNRLQLFARQPAPVQISFAGYPGGTGIETIRYRITDPYLDPPGQTDGDYCEESLRLTHSFWCFDPVAKSVDKLAPAAPLEGSRVTFGSLNSFTKVNPAVIDLWAAVLRAVPESRFLVLTPRGQARQRFIDLMKLHDIDPLRLDFADRAPRKAYLENYRRFDIGLDTFPYNGHTTSLDAFWMGVPVVTLVGKTVVGRAGFSQLSNLGLTELAAKTPEEFVRIATELANDIPRLSNLRSTLRQRLLDSPLANADAFTRDIESIFRKVWRTWCQEKS